MRPIFTNAADVKHAGPSTLLTFGLPLPKGTISNISQISLRQNNLPLEAELSPTGYWEESSIRWISCKALVKQSGRIDIYHSSDTDRNTTAELVDTALPIRELIPTSPVKTGSLSLEAPDGLIFKHVQTGLKASLHLHLKGESKPLILIVQSNKQIFSPLTENYDITGYFKLNEKQLNVHVYIQLCKKTEEISIRLKAHNPNAAAHKGGKWDLGDSKSLYIADFSILFTSSSDKMGVLLVDEGSPSPENTKPIFYDHDFTLKQFGSGGEHWQSPIHWDENKQSSVYKQGYEFHNGKDMVDSGYRAQPLIIFSEIKDNDHGQHVFSLMLEGFWQNFPISLMANKLSCRWQLFADTTELQGGESKTWQFEGHIRSTCSHNKSNILKFDDYTSAELRPSCTLIYQPAYLNQCMVFPHIFFSKAPSLLGEFIQRGLRSERNFFEKRERNDVFGWRHYGEIDADHEAVNSPKDDYFISHYNNQYDPLLGMTLQFLHQGDPLWLKLIKPLNQHIQDIDIYDTDKDKAEYNGGLMWHTDHYLSAETSTHRSNSKHHQHAYEGFLGGGGPGGQHCYTSGLAMQYWLFGDQDAKQKVAQLCRWVRNFYNGSGSILERTFRLVNIDFKPNQLTNIGMKAPGFKYPLDRGTGNFINALIDHYDISGSPIILMEVGDVIRQTFHPNEDIANRGLKNVENAWFYTIFLQAVMRYLLLKESIEEIDDDYRYARDGFMHYGKWMLNNESFYLDDPEQLEFPNDTWCAQEVRKANLFYYFYYFSSEKNENFLVKAKEYYAYIYKRLSVSKEAQYTRILAILMQNDGVQQRFDTGKPRSSVPLKTSCYGEAPKFSKTNVIKQYLQDIWYLSKHFSLKKEYRWLFIRLKNIIA